MKLIEEADKIFPKKYVYIIFSSFIVLCIFMLIFFIVDNLKENKDFYKTKLKGKVEDIYFVPSKKYFKIDRRWYLIRDECIKHISTGDSIFKESHSYVLEIYGGLSNSLKFKEEVKHLDFKYAGNEALPN